MEHIIPINRGSDWPFTGTFTNANGAAINLTGYAVSVVEASPQLVSQITVSITNAAAGTISGNIEWADTIIGDQLRFRIKAAIGATDITWPMIWVKVQ